MLSYNKMSTPKRPRSVAPNTNLPPSKKQKMMVSNAMNKLANNFAKFVNIPSNQYNLGTITSVSEPALGLRLSRKLVDDFKRIYSKSFENQIEHVGSVQFMVKNVRGYVKFNKPTVSTNRSFTKVAPRTNELNSYIMYHTHPIPRDDPDNTFTLPSFDDFSVYINFYPYIQANIILERNGYYVIDLIENDQFKKPSLSDVKNYWTNEIMTSGKFINFSRVYRGIYFYSANPGSWQQTINGFVNSSMMSKFGISVKYYKYSELAPITLLDKTQIMLP